MAGYLTAQTAIVKSTPQGPERIKALGRLTSAYTLGGVCGPYLGGLLGSNGDYVLGARLAAAGMGLAGILMLFMPTQPHAQANSPVGKGSFQAPTSVCSRLQQILNLVILLLFVKFGTSITNSMARSAQPVRRVLLRELAINFGK